MQQRLASLLLATSIRAHGYTRARHWLHHIFGGILVLLVAIVVALAAPRRVFRSVRSAPPGD